MDRLKAEGRGKTILITGATGGLGQALCRCFAKDVCRIAVHTYRNQKQGKKLIEELRGNHCETALFSADLKDPAAVQKMFRELEDRWGGADLLINNAGFRNDRLLQATKGSDWDEGIAMNLSGAFYCMREAASLMRLKGSGHIINISSQAAFTGRIGQASYTAAKRGLIAMSRSAAKEWGSVGIQVNAVCPGFLPTPMTEGLQTEQAEAIIAENVLGRHSTCEEVAQFVRHLSEMKHVSGQTFNLDSRIV